MILYVLKQAVRKSQIVLTIPVAQSNVFFWRMDYISCADLLYDPLEMYLSELQMCVNNLLWSAKMVTVAALLGSFALHALFWLLVTRCIENSTSLSR